MCVCVSCPCARVRRKRTQTLTHKGKTHAAAEQAAPFSLSTGAAAAKTTVEKHSTQGFSFLRPSTATRPGRLGRKGPGVERRVIGINRNETEMSECDTCMGGKKRYLKDALAGGKTHAAAAGSRERKQNGSVARAKFSQFSTKLK